MEVGREPSGATLEVDDAGSGDQMHYGADEPAAA